MKSVLAVIGFLTAAFLPVQTLASVFSDEVCVIVLASDKTEQELLANPSLADRNGKFWVVSTKSGILAAVAGYIPKFAADDFMAELHAAEAVPSDAFCMGGDKIENLVHVAREGKPVYLDSMETYRRTLAPSKDESRALALAAIAQREADDRAAAERDRNKPGPNPASQITIANINWSMTPSRMRLELEAAGMECFVYDIWPNPIICESERGRLQIYDSYVSFQCKFTGTCGLSADRIIDSFKNSFAITDQFQLSSVGGIHATHFCSRSQGGDVICMRLYYEVDRDSQIILLPDSPTDDVNFN